MGISVQPRMQFNLSSLISLYVNMDSLISPFLTGEIDNIIRHLPLDKAPSPDGFNGSFSKNAGQSSKKIFISCVKISLMDVSTLRALMDPLSH
jgi:hypothetical protein